MDVSSDITFTDKREISENDFIYPSLSSLCRISDTNVPVMIFSDGRCLYDTQSISEMSRQDLCDMYRNIGYSTAINNAIASALNISPEIRRILILTNGKDTSSSLTASTLTKILKQRGVAVDGLIFEIKADSVKEPDDTVYYPYSKHDKRFESIIRNTGGCLKVLTESGISGKQLTHFINACASAGIPSPKSSNLDKELTDKVISRLKPYSVYYQQVDTATCIRYNDVVYHGLKEVIAAAKDRKIGLDEMKYPCFDSYDYDNENRYYQNYYFGRNIDELDRKRDELKSVKPATNYCKLTHDTPLSLLPVLYYCGDGDKMLICGLDIVYDIDDPDSE